jgi:2-amino-4-hydroxy-6-hydroxymethyldihydropteridine diphosphokinase
MMTRRIYLSLGSNLGDREAHLRAALHALGGALNIRQVSSLFLTDPVGVTHQPEFANLALEADTSLEPLELLREVKRVEHEVGRRPTFRWGPRVVDIDILLYDDLVLETPELTIPHREMTRRAFVLLPLAEIAPQVVHPIERRTISDLAADFDGSDGVRPTGDYGENRSSANGSPSL